MPTDIPNPSRASLSIRLLGPYQVQVDGQTIPLRHSRKEQWLLALLILRQGRVVERDWLSDTLWPDSARSRVLLRDTLYDLRQTLGSQAERLHSPTKQTLQFDLEGADVDVLAFDAALDRGDTPSLELAIGLYRGALLEGCTEEWVLAERQAREQAYLNALETLSARATADGQPAAAVRWLRLLLATDPYRESACCALMQALADCGDPATMTQVYRDLRLLLRRDLNTDPAPETQALYNRLRTTQTRPIAQSFASPLPAKPLRRLPVPLSDLIGREQEIEEVCGWLGRSRLVTLVGTGGVGKTRLSLAVAERGGCRHT